MNSYIVSIDFLHYYLFLFKINLSFINWEKNIFNHNR